MRRMLILLAASMALIAASGCGKDSTKSNVGDENDARFVLAKADIDSAMLEYNLDDEDGSAWVASALPLAKIALIDSVAFDSVNYWHIYAGAHQGEFLTWTRIDSFRYADTLGEYQQYLNAITKTFEHRLIRMYNFNNQTSGVNWVKRRHRNVKWDGFTGSSLVLTGNFDRSYIGQNPNWDFTHSMIGAFDSVMFETADFLNGLPTHPIAGQITGTTNHHRQSNTENINLISEYTVTFSEDHYHVHLVSGSNSWDWDHYYDD
jgi:hypothetical protein